MPPIDCQTLLTPVNVARADHLAAVRGDDTLGHRWSGLVDPDAGPAEHGERQPDDERKRNPELTKTHRFDWARAPFVPSDAGPQRRSQAADVPGISMTQLADEVSNSRRMGMRVTPGRSRVAKRLSSRTSRPLSRRIRSDDRQPRVPGKVTSTMAVPRLGPGNQNLAPGPHERRHLLQLESRIGKVLERAQRENDVRLEIGRHRGAKRHGPVAPWSAASCRPCANQCSTTSSRCTRRAPHWVYIATACHPGPQP